MSFKRADWGARYEVMSTAMSLIRAVAESMCTELEGYDPDKGGELIADLACTYEEAVGSYNWPESDFWTEWDSYKEWHAFMKEKGVL